MKTFIIITISALCSYGVGAQSTKASASKKGQVKTAAKTKIIKPARSNNSQFSSTISPGIDSFKRSNRYSPGRPYEATTTNGTTAENTANGVGSNNVNRAVNAGSPNPQVTNNGANNQVLNNGNAVINNRQGNIPVSPGNERNRADVNQRQMNENSKNAISDMSSGQVNVLNQNQMAPPPQNWGNNTSADNKWGRNTVGESQWTPTATLSSSFSRDNPNVSVANWRRDVRDTTNYSARYRVGDYWAMSTYNATGTRVDTRTEFPLTDLPQPVSLYSSKQGVDNVRLQGVTRIDRPAKPGVYEVILGNGKIVYVNNEGMETDL